MLRKFGFLPTNSQTDDYCKRGRLKFHRHSRPFSRSDEAVSVRVGKPSGIAPRHWSAAGLSGRPSAVSRLGQHVADLIAASRSRRCISNNRLSVRSRLRGNRRPSYVGAQQSSSISIRCHQTLLEAPRTTVDTAKPVVSSIVVFKCCI